MVLDAGAAKVDIDPDLSRFGAKLSAGINAELKGVEKGIAARMSKLSGNLSNVGRTLTRSVTLPILAVGAVSVKSSLDFESAFAGVQKTVEGTTSDFAKLSKGLRDLAVQTGTNVVQLTGIAEAAGALGIPTKDILGFVETVNKLDVATDLTAESAATSLGKLRNVLDLSVGDLSNLSAALVDLGNTGASTEPEIVDLALRFASTGKNAGLTTAEILAFSAAIADAGIPAERGGTAISKTFQDIAVAVATGGKDLKRFAKVAGLSAEDFAKDFKDKPARAAAAFIDGLQRIRKEAGPGGVIKTLKDLGISESRQIDLLQTLSNAQTGVTEKVSQATKAYKDGTAANKEFEKFMATNAKKIDKVKTAFADIAIELGNKLVPILTKPETLKAIGNIGESLGNIIEWFGKLDPGWQERIVKLFAFAVVGGPILTGLGSATRLLGSIAGIFKTTRGAKLAGDIAAIGTNAGTAVGPVGGLLSKMSKLVLLATNPITISVLVAWIVGKPLVERGAKNVGRATNRAGGGLPAGEALKGPQGDPIKELRERIALLRTTRVLGEQAAQAILKATDNLNLAPKAAQRVEDSVNAIILAARQGLDIPDLIEKIANFDFTQIRSAEELAAAFGIPLNIAEQIIKDLDLLNGKKVKAEVQLDVKLPKGFVPGVGISPGISDLVVSGKRARGGSVIANRAYVVGEEGRELFIPREDGDIIPHGQFGEGGGVTVPVTLQIDKDVLARKTVTVNSRQMRKRARAHG